MLTNREWLVLQAAILYAQFHVEDLNDHFDDDCEGRITVCRQTDGIIDENEFQALYHKLADLI